MQALLSSVRHEIYSWLPPDPPMSGTIQLYHSELPVHTFALGICREFVCYTHGRSLLPDLMEHPICSTGGSFEDRVEYITKILKCDTCTLSHLKNGSPKKTPIM